MKAPQLPVDGRFAKWTAQQAPANGYTFGTAAKTSSLSMKNRNNMNMRWVFALLCFAMAHVSTAQPTPSTVGKMAFYFDNGGKMKSPIKVFYYSPKADAANLPIVMLMHGAERDASAYMDGVISTANTLGCIVIAPEFDKEDYNGADLYNLGNVYDRNRKSFTAAKQWSFSLIEPLFDFVVKKTESKSTGYYLYGHSAGAQFVHRFLMFVDGPRVIRAGMANAGWYTLPDVQMAFPYGLKGSPVDTSKLARFFATRVCVLLGTADTDRSSVGFNVTDEAEAQGKTRFERGKYYFENCKATAAHLQSVFNWELILVPDVGHNNGKMAETGLPCLLGVQK
ncbi:MAG: alpha/beta hydrolase [Bacteroidetes bacterium]|nr:MAG: alpha/beta hydrolase [Bacteroidota bacterium]